jgi:hypothetical protein
MYIYIYDRGRDNARRPRLHVRETHRDSRRGGLAHRAAGTT